VPPPVLFAGVGTELAPPSVEVRGWLPRELCLVSGYASVILYLLCNTTVVV